MLHNNDARRKIRRNLRKDELESVWPSRRNPDGDDSARRQHRPISLFLTLRIIGHNRRRQLAADHALRQLDLFDQLGCDRFEMSGRSIDWLWNEIDCA